MAFDPNILIPVDVVNTSLSTDFTLIKNLHNRGRIIVSMACATGPTSGDGALANIIFNVSPTANFSDSTELVIETLSLFDANGEPIDFIKQNGLFKVQDDDASGNVNTDNKESVPPDRKDTDVGCFISSLHF